MWMPLLRPFANLRGKESDFLMTQKESHAVVLFESVSHALRAEKLLKAAGLICKLVPVPRHLSSDCGVCLRIHFRDAEAVKKILAGKLDFFEIHSL